MLEVTRNNVEELNNKIHWRKAKRKSCDKEIPFKKLVIFDDNSMVIK